MHDTYLRLLFTTLSDKIPLGSFPAFLPTTNEDFSNSLSDILSCPAICHPEISEEELEESKISCRKRNAQRKKLKLNGFILLSFLSSSILPC